MTLFKFSKAPHHIYICSNNLSQPYHNVIYIKHIIEPQSERAEKCDISHITRKIPIRNFMHDRNTLSIKLKYSRIIYERQKKNKKFKYDRSYFTRNLLCEHRQKENPYETYGYYSYAEKKRKSPSTTVVVQFSRIKIIP